MGYLTLGADGRVTKDDQSVFAQGLIIPRNYQDDVYYNEVFPGSIELGKKKKKGGIFKKLKKLHKMLSPHHLIMSKLMKKKKGKSHGGGDEMGPESEGEASAAPEMTATSGQSQQTVPESAPPPSAAPSIEQRAEDSPNASPPMREEEGHAPPPVPDSGAGPSDETATPPPWAKSEAPEPESPFAPGEGHASSVESDEPPQSSVDGMGVGGWLTTESSPTQHAWENRARRSRLRASRGRGGEVSVYTPPRSRATPPMWSRSLSVKRDRMGRSGIGSLAGSLSDGANTLLNAARGEVSQSWATLDQARIAWNQSRRVNFSLDAALKAATAALDMFKNDADKLLIARGVEAGKKLNGWLTAQSRFMGDYGEALDMENPALVTEIGKWTEAFVPARNAVASGFLKDPLMEGIKAGASTFGTGLYNLAAGVARVAAKVGTGVERAVEDGVPWWVWVGGGLLILNTLRK